MNRVMYQVAVLVAVTSILRGVHADEPDGLLGSESRATLEVPSLESGGPRAGRRVRVTPSEYAGTQVFHTVYLPEDWSTDGPPLPIVFEYTGNEFLKSGSTGKSEDAALGFGLSGGQCIWVTLPFVDTQSKSNAVRWWGDEEATVAYAKRNVPRIIERYHAAPRAVFLCGFSRGAIGVNYIGLHDDEIAGLWSAFVTHDHFDGLREWRGTRWGSPLDAYQLAAQQRLRRVDGRPYLVIENGSVEPHRAFAAESLAKIENFTFLSIDTGEVFGTFPSPVAKSGHTDRWLLRPSKYRRDAWDWFNGVLMRKQR